MSPTARRRLSTSPTRARISPAALWLVSASRSARLSPIPAMDAFIRAPSATIRSTVAERVRSRPWAMSTDVAPSDAISRWPASVRRSLKPTPAALISWLMPSWAVAIASRTRVPLVTMDSR